MEIEWERRHARARLTMAHESWREAADKDEPWEAFATAMRYRLTGMIEMFAIIFPQEGVSNEMILAELDEEYRRNKLPR